MCLRTKLKQQSGDIGSTTIDNIFTVDDEALSFVLFENGILRWNKEMEIRNKHFHQDPSQAIVYKLTNEEKATLPHYIYTSKLSGEKIAHQGWQEEGKSRFLYYKKLSKKFRERDNSELFYKRFLNALKYKSLDKKKQAKDDLTNAEMDRLKRKLDIINDPDLSFTFQKRRHFQTNLDQEEVENTCPPLEPINLDKHLEWRECENHSESTESL